MRTRNWIAGSLVACLIAASASAELLPTRRLEKDSPSKMVADWQLARYAEHNAASGQVRDLGRRMTGIIERDAAGRGISLSSPMDERDRHTVRLMETLQGDDFDVAYIDMNRN